MTLTRHYEIVIRRGDTERITPARLEEVCGVAKVLHYGQPGAENMTSGDPPLNSDNHLLTRAAMNLLDRELAIGRNGLHRRPLKFDVPITLMIRETNHKEVFDVQP